MRAAPAARAVGPRADTDPPLSSSPHSARPGPPSCRKSVRVIPAIMDLVNRVKSTIKKYSLAGRAEKILAAVSGGPDSTALLHVLLRLRDELGFSLAVCHLNHNLRGEESKRDMAFVEKTASTLGLEFYGKTLRAGTLKKRGESLQAAARQARLSFYEEAARKLGAGRVALGHTMDDRAETLLMRLMKGASLAGLAGMRPMRGIYIRPLIETEKQKILDFLQNEGIAYVVDSSNMRTDYLRNDIRMNLIPYLKECYNPSIVSTLARTAEILSHDEDFIKGIADFLDVTLKRTKRAVVLDRKRLRDLHPALLSRVFLKAATGLGPGQALTSSHIESVMELVRGDRPNWTVKLPGSLNVTGEYDRVIFSIGLLQRPMKPFEVPLVVPGETKVAGTGFAFSTEILKRPPEDLKGEERAVFFDYDRIVKKGGRLFLRQFRPGDRMALAGGGHKKVKEVFIEARVPPRLRQRIPLLATDSEVLWVPGIKRSGLCMVTPRTKRVLKIVFTRKGRRVI